MGVELPPEKYAKWREAKNNYQSWDDMKKGKLLQAEYVQDSSNLKWESPEIWQNYAQMGEELWKY